MVAAAEELGDGAGDFEDVAVEAFTYEGQVYGSLSAVAKAVKSGDVDKLTAATKEYSTAGNELVAAEDALRKAVEG